MPLKATWAWLHSIMKKLLMAEGLSRNQVNRMVREQRTDGSTDVSNVLYYCLLKGNIPLLKDTGNGELLPLMSSFVVTTKELEDGQENSGSAG